METESPDPSITIAATVLLALLAAGCALPGGGSPSADERFDRGLSLAQEGAFPEATRELAASARTCGTDPLGQQAVLALSALELDPRHEAGSPERAARLALHLLGRPDRARWTGRMATVLYLLASELRTDTAPLEAGSVEALYPDTPETSVRWSSCGPRLGRASADSTARPRLPGPSLAARAARWRARARELQAEVERLRSLLESPQEPR